MRTKKKYLRPVKPDVKFASSKIAKLINYVMVDGKKAVAQKHVYAALEKVALESKKKPLEAFEEAIANIIPEMEVRSRRVGGAAYQVPMPVRPSRGFALALRWLVQEANKRPNATYPSFSLKLASEILDALNNTGGAIAKKQTVQKAVEANKAFAHFRW